MSRRNAVLALACAALLGAHVVAEDAACLAEGDGAADARGSSLVQSIVPKRKTIGGGYLSEDMSRSESHKPQISEDTDKMVNAAVGSLHLAAPDQAESVQSLEEDEAANEAILSLVEMDIVTTAMTDLPHEDSVGMAFSENRSAAQVNITARGAWASPIVQMRNVLALNHSSSELWIPNFGALLQKTSEAVGRDADTALVVILFAFVFLAICFGMVFYIFNANLTAKRNDRPLQSEDRFGAGRPAAFSPIISRPGTSNARAVNWPRENSQADSLTPASPSNQSKSIAPTSIFSLRELDLPQLCPHLVVPDKCESVLAVPIQPLLPPRGQGFLDVRDAEGHVLLRLWGGEAARNRAAGARLAGPTSFVEHMQLCAPDGTTLARCSGPPIPTPGRARLAYERDPLWEFHLLRPDGTFFGKLVRETTDGRHSFVPASGGKLYFWSTSRHQESANHAKIDFVNFSVNVTDENGGLRATVEDCVPPFCKPGDKYFQLRVAPLTDVSIILCCLCCIDFFGPDTSG